MDINPENVRRSPRPTTDYVWGNDLLSAKADIFKSELIKILVTEGYKERLYFKGNGLETVAYILEEVPFRQEPILLDDGCRIAGTQRILSIAIRDALGMNRRLYHYVHGLLTRYTIRPARESNNPCNDGTRVFMVSRY
jgi:hypothetical protein